MNTDDDNEQDYISFKKVLLFGAGSTGKTSFSIRLQTRKFKENIPHTQEG